MSEQQLHETLVRMVGSMFDDRREVALDADLLAAGVDSFKMMELIVLIENEFDIEFGDEDLVEKNFVNLAAISRLIGGKYLPVVKEDALA